MNTHANAVEISNSEVLNDKLVVVMQQSAIYDRNICILEI